jgi:hypothetical protein
VDSPSRDDVLTDQSQIASAVGRDRVIFDPSHWCAAPDGNGHPCDTKLTETQRSRRARYCSTACRQRASRDRRKRKKP